MTAASKGFFRRFREELVEQRWDDHRFYHQHRMNQTLHWVSSISFLVMYAMLIINPSALAAASLLGWLFAMASRQIGHFFFEPRDYDHVNRATHEHKEDIKVGYNLHRKRMLYALWALIPIVLVIDPTFFGTMAAYSNLNGFMQSLGIAWAVLGIGALIFRTIHLFFIRDVFTGLVWFTKILTDPFHDFKIYAKAPWYLMKGEIMDPIDHSFRVKRDDEEEAPVH